MAQPSGTVDIPSFCVRLAETITWSNIYLTGKTGDIRSPILRPSDIWLEKPETRVSVVDDLAERRAALLHSKGVYPAEPANTLAGGRLLVCASPDENIADGALVTETKGFFDDEDFPPPWDFWLYYL